MVDQDVLVRVYATIKSLRDIVAAETIFFTQGMYADQYNTALDRLITNGFDVQEFKVPPSSIAPHREQTNYITMAFRVTEPRVDRGLLLSRMNAVLTYFDITAEGGSHLQFRGPRSKK